MPTLEYFLVSESISVDQATNQVSLFNVLEDVQSTAFPIVLPHLAVVASWNVAEDEVGGSFTASLGISVPGAGMTTQVMPFTPAGRRHRMFTRIVGLPIPEEGTLVCHVAVDGVHHASHTIHVRRVDAPPAYVVQGSYTTH